MKQILFILCINFAKVGLAQTSFINIIDTNFEQILISQKIDSDGSLNGQISTIDAERISFLNISNAKIDNLSGIEGFKNLSYLDCSKNNLNTLNLSSNVFLESLDCSFNHLTLLNLSKNYNLSFLSCLNNKLKEIICESKTFSHINAKNNLLEKVDFTKCPALAVVYISDNLLSTIVLNNNLLLREFICSNNKLKNIETSSNNYLYILDVSNNELTTLNLCKNTSLLQLNVSQNKLETIYFNDNDKTLKISNLDNSIKLLGCK